MYFYYTEGALRRLPVELNQLNRPHKASGQSPMKEDELM